MIRGSNHGGSEIFRTRPDRPRAQPASYTMGTGSFPEVKRPGGGVDHPPTSSAEVKERVKLYLYFPSGPSWPVLGRTLPLYLYLVHLLEADSIPGPYCGSKNVSQKSNDTIGNRSLEYYLTHAYLYGLQL
jgi:hypothetical protein